MWGQCIPAGVFYLLPSQCGFANLSGSLWEVHTGTHAAAACSLPLFQAYPAAGAVAAFCLQLIFPSRSASCAFSSPPLAVVAALLLPLGSSGASSCVVETKKEVSKAARCSASAALAAAWRKTGSRVTALAVAEWAAGLMQTSHFPRFALRPVAPLPQHAP